MKKTLLALSLTAGVLLGAGGTIASGAGDHYYWHIPTRPCAQEDSHNCYWDAGRLGGGGGDSFWTGRAGKHHYMNPHLGR